MSDSVRILCLGDISCVGRCSFGVADAAITALGCECAMLPLSLLSTHTGGFEPPEKLDCTEFCRRALRSLSRQQIPFAAVMCGYTGSVSATNTAAEAFAAFPAALKLADPAFADEGRVYSGIDGDTVAAIAELCRGADIMLPNLSEAQLLCGAKPTADVDAAALAALARALNSNCCKLAVITGVRSGGKNANVICRDGLAETVAYNVTGPQLPGTGDLFAAVFAAATLRGAPTRRAVELAAAAVAAAVSVTAKKKRPARFGAAVEEIIPLLVNLGGELN